MAVDHLKLVFFGRMLPHDERFIPARGFNVAPQFGQRFHIHPITVLRMGQDVTNLNFGYHGWTLL